MAVKQLTVRLPRSGRDVTVDAERKRVKNINMRVKPGGVIHVSVPVGTSDARIRQFLTEKEDWLSGALDKVAARAEAHPDAAALAARDSLPYLGGSLSVRYVPCAGRTGRFSLDEKSGVLTVEIPDPSSPGWRQSAVEAFEKAQSRIYVVKYIKKHFPAFAARGIAPPADVRVRQMTSRHGSCSSATHALTFNAKLCEYPEDFIEYVVVHELCHFLHMDHSPAFWREVARILPDWQRRRAMGRED